MITNIYHCSQMFNDGEDSYPVVACLIRAESPEKAREIAYQRAKENPMRGELANSWLDEKLVEIKQLGWSTGEYAYQSGMINLVTGESESA